MHCGGYVLRLNLRCKNLAKNYQCSFFSRYDFVKSNAQCYGEKKGKCYFIMKENLILESFFRKKIPIGKKNKANEKNIYI